MNGTVRVNCVLEVQAGPALAKLRALASHG